jgi:hypothetical protein
MRFIKSMANEGQGVEAKTEIAPIQSTGVETKSTEAPVEDPEVKLNALLEENAKLTEERDNYRAATLALKGKKDMADMDLTDPVQMEAYINKSIENRLLQEKQASSDGALADYAKELARKNKELALALNAKSSVSNVASGGGGTTTGTTSVGSYFSPEQQAELKKRWKAQGVPESQHDEMLKKSEEMAKRNPSGAI